MCLSSWGTTSLEDVAESSPQGLKWFQLYVYKERKLTEALVKRAEKAGYKAIALTVDTPILGKRVFLFFFFSNLIYFPIFLIFFLKQNKFFLRKQTYEMDLLYLLIWSLQTLKVIQV